MNLNYDFVLHFCIFRLLLMESIQGIKHFCSGNFYIRFYLSITYFLFKKHLFTYILIGGRIQIANFVAAQNHADLEDQRVNFKMQSMYMHM